MQNATTPGANMNDNVFTVRPSRKKSLRKRDGQFSKETLTIPKVSAMQGASQKIVATGLSKPILLLLRRTCVRLQRRPPRALALRTRIKPCNTNSASVATMRRTPEKIKKITATRRHEKISSRKRKANSSTKIRDDDLHIAIQRNLKWKEVVNHSKLTVKG